MQDVGDLYLYFELNLSTQKDMEGQEELLGGTSTVPMPADRPHYFSRKKFDIIVIFRPRLRSGFKIPPHTGNS